MAKSAPKEQWRALRRYALSGDLRRARRLLLMMVEKYPADAEAAAELKRLESGSPLHCTESKQERHRRLIEEALLAIEEDIRAHQNPHKLAVTPTEQLTRLRRSLQERLKLLLADKTPAPPGTNSYKKELERELARRHKKNRRTRLLVAGLLLIPLLLAGGTAWALRSKAAQLTEQLEQARTAQDWERVKALLEAADTGVNRLMYARTGQVITLVRLWQQNTISRADELSHRLYVYEKGHASSLSLSERADFLRGLRALPEHFARELRARWEDFCRPEREQLDAQKDAVVAEIEAASTAPTLSGRVREDTALIRKTKSHLERVIDSFDNARETFDLPPGLITPCQALLTQLEGYLADIEALNHTQNVLRNARSYRQHLAAFAQLAPQYYPPALAIAKTGQTLPTEERITNEIRAAHFNLPLEIPEAVIKAIVEKGPSFCAGYPANLQHLHLMEDMFTARTLHQRVYEVFRATGEVHYTEQPPLVHTEKNSVTFTLSELDPARKVSRSPQVEWPGAHEVWIRTLDATPLIKSTGIARGTFFLTANLPDMLGKITAIHEKDCPALAKAYAYHTLLEVMRLHKSDILGLRFSPLLQEDIKSFRLMLSHSKVKLSVTCWLSRKNEVMAAEALCAQWFAEHADRDYAAEMSARFSRILRTAPRYLGYADADGQPHTLQPPMENAKLWYYSEGKLISTPGGKPLKAPSPYTPIFVL